MVTYTFICLPTGLYDAYRSASYLGEIVLEGDSKRDRAASYLHDIPFLVCRGPSNILVVLTEEE